MDRRGEVEIVINTRWLERAFFLLVIVILAGLCVWLYTRSAAAAGADATATIASQQAQIQQLNAQVSDLTAKLGAAGANATNTSAAPTSATAPPPVQASSTSPSSAPAPAAPQGNGKIAVSWSHTGVDDPSTNTYKLSAVTITIQNGLSTLETVDYALCWSSIECTYSVTRGSVTVPAGKNTVENVDLTIPHTVSTTTPQTLYLVVNDTQQTIFADTKTVT